MTGVQTCALPIYQLSDLKRFYVEGLQLNILAEFSGNDGYDGLIIGLPDEAYQQAFVHRAGGSPGADRKSVV